MCDFLSYFLKWLVWPIYFEKRYFILAAYLDMLLLFFCQKIEEQCIQDLMYTAVHANRSGPHAAFPALRKVWIRVKCGLFECRSCEFNRIKKHNLSKLVEYCNSAI